MNQNKTDTCKHRYPDKRYSTSERNETKTFNEQTQRRLRLRKWDFEIIARNSETKLRCLASGTRCKTFLKAYLLSAIKYKI